MSHGETVANPVQVSKVEEKEGTIIDLYIGVFFDGTNNNKYQVMLGKLFRWKEIYEKHCNDKKFIECFKDTEEPNVYSILRKPRSYWESGGGKGVFSQSEIEYLYYGYGDINNATSFEHNTLIEEKSLKALEDNDPHHLTAKPDKKEEGKKLQEVAGRIVGKSETNKYKSKLSDESVKGAFAQNSTYTNVAILESLYVCGDKKNDQGEITERHVSIYIEGSGTDMQIAAVGLLHKIGYILLGLGKGTGPTGVEAKTKKAVQIINRIKDQFSNSNRKRLHFDICGFSRGATSARMLCYAINANPISPNQSYNGPHSIKESKKHLKRFTGIKKEFLPIDLLIEEKEIRNLLIADTVASIGVKAFGFWKQLLSFPKLVLFTISRILGGIEDIVPAIDENGHYRLIVRKVDDNTQDTSFIGISTYHHNNVDDYGLWATALAQNTIHICAMDELRENFALVDIESSISNNTGTEIFLPGCHTDIGGGTSLGREDAYVIVKHDKRRLFSFLCNCKEDITKNNLLPINERTLKQLGWIPKDQIGVNKDDKTVSGRITESYLKEHDETSYADNSFQINAPNLLFLGQHDNIVLNRHVQPGYSNISLEIFRHKSKGNPFDKAPLSFAIPNELKSFAKEIVNAVEKPNRYFIYPKDQEEYRALRNKYIHLSFNEQSVIYDISNNSVVNGPEFVKRTLQKDEDIFLASRIVYKGEYDVKYDEMVHLFDYEKSRVKTKNIHINLNAENDPSKKLVSKNGMSMIKKHEGCKLDAYQDTVGVWTIGYGHTAGVKEGMSISQSEADDMFAEEVESYASEVVNMVDKTLNQNQIDSLTSFAYNVGIDALRGSTLLKRINDERSTEDSIREQFNKWVYADGKVENGLVHRRKEEADLFFKRTN